MDPPELANILRRAVLSTVVDFDSLTKPEIAACHEDPPGECG